MLAVMQKTGRILWIVWTWTSPMTLFSRLPFVFPACLPYTTFQKTYQFKHTTPMLAHLWPSRTNIWELSEFLLYQFTYAWARSKCFKTKAFWILFMASENPANWFMPVIFIEDFCLSETSIDSRSSDILLKAMLNTLGCMKSIEHLNKDLKFIFSLEVSTRILKRPLSQNIGRAPWSSCFAIFTKFNIDVYTVEYSVMDLRMNGRKLTCIFAILAENNIDLPHAHDGIMSLSPAVCCN